MAGEPGPRGKADQLRAEAERLQAEAEMWERGADGEDTVQALLEAGLPADQGWHVERNVIISSTGVDIDHLVVGPPGVFTINTKHHPGKKIWVSPVQFLVDGHPQDYLQKSDREAMRAIEQLSVAIGKSVDVQAVIVVVDAATVTVVEQPVRTRVEKADEIVAWLLGLPTALIAETAASIAAAVSDPDTWIDKEAERATSTPRPTRRSPRQPSRLRRRSARSASFAGPAAVVISVLILLAFLYHSSRSGGLLGTNTTTSTSSTSTSAPVGLQAVGTATNGQCVDAWSNHDVEIQVSGPKAGPDCSFIAVPAVVAKETSSAAEFGTPTGPFGRAAVGSGLNSVCSTTLASGDRVTVYDDGGEAIGHAFCTSFTPGS